MSVKSEDAPVAPLLGESRWPPIAAIGVFLVMNVSLRIWSPSDSPISVPWLLPTVEVVLLVILLTSDPSGPVERRRLRYVALALVGVLVAAALWATALLLDDLIRGKGVSNSAGKLLVSGGVVWLGNNLAFALLYWQLDGGGPNARLRRSIPVDFAFVQHTNPDLAPPGWRPVFLDYLHLGFTNATAFSPTDVLPLTHRAKYAMLLQATVSLALLGVVVARAVNVFK